jgi:nucleotide-binding universal stress UspA family protein
MYDRILVPTDGSQTASAAMSAAVEIASRDRAEIHVLNVINTRYYDTSIDSAVEPLRERGEGYVDSLAELAADADVPVTTAVEIGRPAGVILAYVDDYDIDLVVMGTSGRGDLERRLLGSTTEHVVTHAGVPVHVVPSV